MCICVYIYIYIYIYICIHINTYIDIDIESQARGIVPGPVRRANGAARDLSRPSHFCISKIIALFRAVTLA